MTRFFLLYLNAFFDIIHAYNSFEHNKLLEMMANNSNKLNAKNCYKRFVNSIITREYKRFLSIFSEILTLKSSKKCPYFILQQGNIGDAIKSTLFYRFFALFCVKNYRIML